MPPVQVVLAAGLAAKTMPDGKVSLNAMLDTGITFAVLSMVKVKTDVEPWIIGLVPNSLLKPIGVGAVTTVSLSVALLLAETGSNRLPVAETVFDNVVLSAVAIATSHKAV